MKENIKICGEMVVKIVVLFLSRKYLFARYFFVGCCIVAIPVYARAQVFITEIMYDIEGTDTGREWIEVQNTGSTSVDMSTWKLFEANTNHKITAEGSTLLPGGAFAVIADSSDKFKIDNPGFGGLLFDSVFSLSNEGETIILRDTALADSDAVTYSPAVGGQGDGTTLQKISTGWISAYPTIGSQTTATESVQVAPKTTPPTGDGTATSTSNGTPETSGSPTDDSDTTGEDSKGTTASTNVFSSHSSQSVATISRDIEDFQVTSGRPRLGFVGTPLTFSAKIKTAKNLPSGSLTGTWSMGDGTRYTGTSISHTYQFAGEYIVILNADYGGSEAVSKTKVKIVEPQVSFSTTDTCVEISNLSNLELNVGGWIVESEHTRFIIPKDTIIAKRSSIKIAHSTTGIPNFKDYIRLANPSGLILASVKSPETGPVVVLPHGVDESLLLHRLNSLTYRSL